MNRLKGSASPSILLSLLALILTSTAGSAPVPSEPPVIRSFRPAYGPVGTEVTLTGSGLSGVTAVSFNDQAASGFTVDSDTQLRATAASSTTSGTIAVVNSAGTGTSASSFKVIGAIAAEFVVTTTADNGAGSLREAITNANATPGTALISFQIASGSQTIRPMTNLPLITNPVIIDGTTQPGYAGIPLIELSGEIDQNTNIGLEIYGSHSVVRKLIVNRFRHAGIIAHGSHILITGNYIGTDKTGTTALGNNVGILVDYSADDVIGGTDLDSRNIISGNRAANLNLQNASGTQVVGNYIGTDVTGTIALGAGNGILCVLEPEPNVPPVVIGGTIPEARNVVSGHPGAGILIISRRSHTYVMGNYVGVDATGVRTLGNASGIELHSAQYVHVGGVDAGARNIIAGNIFNVRMRDDVMFSTITGNYIGPMGNGARPEPVGSVMGISVEGAVRNYIDGNVIAYHGRNGIRVEAGHWNVIQGNAVFGNGWLGIDLGGDGVTPNDPGDLDSGPNGLLNFPILTSVMSGGGLTLIRGEHGGRSGEWLEFFASAAGDPSGYGEGERPLGFAEVGGGGSFEAILPTTIGADEVVSATATRDGEGTSEFSPWIAVSPYVADWDGDGIANEVDLEPTKSSNRFSDVPAGGTTVGEVISRGDQTIMVSDRAAPAGVLVSCDVAGGLRPASLNVCNTGFTLDAGNSMTVTCGSLTMAVGVGPVAAYLGREVSASVPSGGVLRMSELGGGQSLISNLSEDPIPIAVSVGEVVSALAPGGSLTVALPEGPPICQVAPDTVQFGTIAPGDVGTGGLVISNVGAGVLSGVVSGLCPGFELVAPAAVYHLGAGESQTVQVRFRPLEEGQFACTLTAGGSGCSPVVLHGTADSSVVASMAFDLTPHTLNLTSRGLWMTGFLEPSFPLAPTAIDIGSIRLNGTVPVDSLGPTALGDHDGNGVPDLMVRFNRAAVELTVSEGEQVPVTVTGIVDGRPFLGTDSIRVRRAVVSAPVAGSHLTGGAVTLVRWQTPSELTVQTVALLQSLDGGATWSLITHGQPNTGRYEWTVPCVVAAQAKVAVVLVEMADTSGLVVDGVLGASEPFTIEGVVGVGDRPAAPLALAIRGARPNPAGGGRLWVEFTLRDASPATLALMDVAGRVLSTREVGSLGPGTHALDLSEGGALRSGIYFLRLMQGGEEVRAQAAVVK